MLDPSGWRAQGAPDAILDARRSGARGCLRVHAGRVQSRGPSRRRLGEWLGESRRGGEPDRGRSRLGVLPDEQQPLRGSLRGPHLRRRGRSGPGNGLHVGGDRRAVAPVPPRLVWRRGSASDDRSGPHRIVDAAALSCQRNDRVGALRMDAELRGAGTAGRGLRLVRRHDRARRRMGNVRAARGARCPPGRSALPGERDDVPGVQRLGR